MNRMKLTRHELARLREVHGLPTLPPPAPATVAMLQPGGRGPRHYQRDRAGLPVREPARLKVLGGERGEDQG